MHQIRTYLVGSKKKKKEKEKANHIMRALHELGSVRQLDNIPSGAHFFFF